MTGFFDPVFDRMDTLGKEKLVENLALAQDHFLFISPFLYGSKKF